MTRVKARSTFDSRALWLLAVLILLTAYYFIDGQYQRSIVTSREATASLYSRTVANRRIVAEARRLSRMQREIDGDLRQLYRKRDENSVSALLELLQGMGPRYGVLVTAIEPQKGNQAQSSAVTAASQSTAENFPDRALVGQDVIIRARGHFDALLRFVENLPRHDTIVAVSQTQLQITGDTAKPTGSEPSLEATIRVTLYALRADTEDDSAAD